MRCPTVTPKTDPSHQRSPPPSNTPIPQPTPLTTPDPVSHYATTHPPDRQHWRHFKAHFIGLLYYLCTTRSVKHVKGHCKHTLSLKDPNHFVKVNLPVHLLCIYEQIKWLIDCWTYQQETVRLQSCRNAVTSETWRESSRTAGFAGEGCLR